MSELYLFLGKEESDKSDAINNIEKELVKKYGEINKERFFFSETLLGTVLDLAYNSNLFSSYNFYICYNCELLKKKDSTKILNSYINSSSNSCLIFLSQENKVDIETLIKKENIKIFWEIDDNLKRVFIHDFFRKNKKNISNDALDFLNESLENNKRMIKNELSKIIDYLKDDTINLEDIEGFLSHSKEENVFTFLDYFCKKDLKNSLISFSIIFLERKNDFDMILFLSSIESQIKKLYEIKKLYLKNKSIQKSLDAFFVKGLKQKENFSNFLKNYSIAEIGRIIRILKKLNYIVRVESKFSKEYIEIFIYESITNSGQSIFLKKREKLFKL